MSEADGQRNYSPLLSERGVTTISGTVVSQVAGMAAQEVEGVHMGGGGARSAGGVLGSITGSESKTSGISVEVGRTEAAIDLKMGVEYNKNILQTVEEVRRRITDRVETITGLRIKELNATITDITFPEKEARRRLEPAKPTTEQEGEPEATQVEATGETADSSVPEEEASAEDRPPEQSETTELRTEEQQTDEVPEASEEAQETSVETETTQEVRAETEIPEESETRPEPETPEERMRRRAEERARRRRRRSQDS